MKRWIACLMLLALVLLAPMTVQAAGTITASIQRIMIDDRPQRVILTLTCTADSADGSYPAFTINPDTYEIRGWYLYSVETDPGATAPQALYDVVINDVGGADVAGSLLNNRSATVTELVYLTSVGYPVIDENWSWVTTGNNVNSAVVVAKLVFVVN